MTGFDGVLGRCSIVSGLLTNAASNSRRILLPCRRSVSCGNLL